LNEDDNDRTALAGTPLNLDPTDDEIYEDRDPLYSSSIKVQNLFSTAKDRRKVDKPLRNLTVDLDLKDADIKFSLARFGLIFVVHGVLIVLGPLLPCVLRLWYGSWHFANNLGLSLNGSTLFFKGFQYMYQMSFLIGNILFIISVLERDSQLLQAHR
jgi:hypothetical protein